MTHSLYQMLADRTSQGRPTIVATVIAVEGSAPLQAGAKALLDGDGRLLAGWAGGGCLDGMVGEEGRSSLLEGTPRRIFLDLVDEVRGVGLPCGGRMEVLLEPITPSPILEIVGRGPIVEFLARFGVEIGFRVRVHSSFVSADAVPGGVSIVAGDPTHTTLAEEPDSWVVVATQNKGDEEALAQALRREAFYISLVASHERGRAVLDRLGEEGFGEKPLASIHTPAGLEIGAQGPAEIALAIVAQIVRIRRGGDTPT